MSLSQALIATQRFGLGAKPGELARLAADPRGWLLDQTSTDAPPPRALAAVQPSAQRVIVLAEARKERQEMKQASEKNPDVLAQLKAQQRDLYLGDVSARL